MSFNPTPEGPEWEVWFGPARQDPDGAIVLPAMYNGIPVAVRLGDWLVWAGIGENDGRLTVGWLEIRKHPDAVGEPHLTKEVLRSVSLRDAIQTAMDTERKLSTRQEQPGSHFDREKQDRLASGPGLDHHARVATHLLIAYKKAPQNANWWLADDYTRKGRHTTSAEVTTWVSEARHRYGLLAPTHRGGQVPPIATEKLRRWQSTHPGSARITAPRGR